MLEALARARYTDCDCELNFRLSTSTGPNGETELTCCVGIKESLFQKMFRHADYKTNNLDEFYGICNNTLFKNVNVSCMKYNMYIIQK